MSTGMPTGDVKRATTRMRILGIVLMILGFVAIVGATATTLLTVITLGVFLLIGSGAQIAGAFWTRGWDGFLVLLLSGLLFFVAGVLMTVHPLAAAAGLTLLLAIAFMAGGLIRIAIAVVQRFTGWGWLLANGLVSFLLGLMIAMSWPFSGTWVIGTFIGIEVLFTGAACFMLASAIGRVVEGMKNA